MALELVAVDGMRLSFTSVVVPPDAAYDGDWGNDTTYIVPTLSTKCKLIGGGHVPAFEKIGTTAVTLMFLPAEGCPYTSNTYTFVSGAGVVMPTATKTRAEGALVLREGDTGTCVGGWTETDPPNTPLVCSCTVEITNAAQTKGKAQ